MEVGMTYHVIDGIVFRTRAEALAYLNSKRS